MHVVKVSHIQDDKKVSPNFVFLSVLDVNLTILRNAFDETANRQGYRIHTFNVIHLFLQLNLQLDGGRQRREK